MESASQNSAATDGLYTRSLRILFVPLFFVAVVLFFLSSKQLVADIYSLYAEGIYTELRAPGRAIAALAMAEELAPLDAHVPYRIAQLESLRGDLNASRLVFERSLRNRPSWPNTWAALASVRLHAGRYDGPFRQAYVRSLDLGEYERNVRLGYVHDYFLLADSLPPDVRAMLKKNARFAAHRWDVAVWLKALEFKDVPRLCRDFPETPRLRKRCRIP